MDYTGHDLNEGPGQADLSSVFTDILPDTDCVYDVGSAAKRFKSAHFCDVTVKPDTNSASTFSVANAAGTKLIDVDTTTDTVNIVGLVTTTTNVENSGGGVLPIVLVDGSVPGQVTLKANTSNLTYVDVGNGLLQLNGSLSVRENLTLTNTDNAAKLVVNNFAGTNILNVNTVNEETQVRKLIVQSTADAEIFTVKDETGKNILKVDAAADEVIVDDILKADSATLTGQLTANNIVTSLIDENVGLSKIVLSANEVFPSANTQQFADPSFRYLNSFWQNIYANGQIYIDGADQTGKFRVVSSLGNTDFRVDTGPGLVIVEGVNNVNKFTVEDDDRDRVFRVDTTNAGVFVEGNDYASKFQVIRDGGTVILNVDTVNSTVDVPSSLSVEGADNADKLVVKTNLDYEVFKIDTTNERIYMGNCYFFPTGNDLQLKHNNGKTAIALDYNDSTRAHVIINGNDSASSSYVSSFLLDYTGAGSPEANGMFMLAGSGFKNFIGFYANGASRGSINWDGSVLSYTGTSDAKLKKNIQMDDDDHLSKIKNVKCRKFNWKTQSDEDDLVYGFVAQEMEQVYPELVSEMDGTPEEGKVKTMNMSGLIPYLVKAVQQLSSENDLLKVEIQELKASKNLLSTRQTNLIESLVTMRNRLDQLEARVPAI